MAFTVTESGTYMWNGLMELLTACGFSVFNVSISVTFLALAVILFRFVFKKAPKWLIVALWALVAIRMVCPYSIESSLSLIPNAETIPIYGVLNLDEQWTPYASFDLVENPVYSEFVDSNVVVDDVELFSVGVLLGVQVWFWGAVAMLIYAALSYIRLRWLVRTAIPLKENVWLCDSVKSPFILGVFHPRIYLPSDMDEQTAELVLRHERAHLKRRDHLWKPFGFVLLSIYWFNPVLWLSYILLCRDIELACDEKVIKGMENADKKAYSEALLSCSIPHRMIAACPVAFGEVGVKKRIMSVLNYKKPAFWVILIAFVVSVVIAVCFMTDPKGQKGGTVTLDEISELSFNMDKIMSSAYAYTVYSGISTTDDYFEVKSDDAFIFQELSSFFINELSLSRIDDGVVNPMHEPQTSGVVKISYDDYWSVSVIFHDDFSKMYMQKNSPDYFLRSKDYAVDNPSAVKKFFNEKPYIDNFFIWEFNPASSALGNGEINFYFDSRYKIDGEIIGEGRIAKITNEGTGAEGFSWSPEIIDNPGEYEFEIPVIRDGEKRVFTFGMKMLGKRGLASYYIIRTGNLQIENHYDGYKYEMTPAYSVDSVSWMYNPRTSDFMACVLPSGYKIKSVAATSGTTKSYESLFFDRGGTVYWTPGKTSEDALLMINSEKDGRSVEFTLYIKFLEYFPAGERRSYTISPVDCWIHDEVRGSGIFCIEEKPQQDEGIIWYYNPFAGATGWYLIDYIFPKSYEIKSAEASNGAIQVENRFYGDDDGKKKVIWTPDFYENETPPAETDIVITAVKDGKEVQFKLKVTLVSGAEGYALNTFKITPVNCKLTEEAWATYLLEEK
ncbi:MAG: M56 family metallopeptidase [Ruminococcaceae bacterium]|nr:M56 family metallopeptidase [Oscillospiraceae bacterium]